PIWSRYIQHFHTCCRYRPRSATSHGPGQHRDLPSFPTRRSSDLQIDVFWAKQGGQDPIELMKKYPQRVTMLHLKDREHGTPDTTDGRAPDETNVALGTGDVNIAGVMKTAAAIGVRHYFIEDESPNVLEQVPLSLEYLRTLVDN